MKKKRSRKESVTLSLNAPSKVLRVFEMASLLSGFQMHEIIEMLLALEVAKTHAEDSPKRKKA